MKASTFKMTFVASSLLAQTISWTAIVTEPELGRTMHVAATLMIVSAFAVLTAPFAFFLTSYHCTRNIKQEYRELAIAGSTLIGIAIAVYLYLEAGQWAAQLV